MTGMGSLDYFVPEGQDPAVVLTALSAAGYSASVDPGDVHLVHVEYPSGPDERERVRGTIESVRTTAIDSGSSLDPRPVRFVDEA